MKSIDIANRWRIKAIAFGFFSLSSLVGCHIQKRDSYIPEECLNSHIFPGERKTELLIISSKENSDRSMIVKKSSSFKYGSYNYDISISSNYLVFVDDEGNRRKIPKLNNYEMNLLLDNKVIEHADVPSPLELYEPVACGSASLYKAFSRLKTNTRFSLEEINEERGDIRRDILGIFDSSYKYGTYEKEMRDIAEKYGFNVETYNGTKDKLLKKMREENGEQKEIIAQIAIIPTNSKETRHWTVYEKVGRKDYYYDLINPVDYYPLYSILVLSEKG